ncbi:MAG: hypothetical protein SYR96_04855 [Actinomycetota bacterium]|nr:hypothetical protein [Actinomycetota bacterium]
MGRRRSGGAGKRFRAVVFFDSLHDLGDPPAALRAAYVSLAEGALVVAADAGLNLVLAAGK